MFVWFKKEVAFMSNTIIVGSARHDENGKYVGGKAGDQLQNNSNNDTVGEVSMQEMYIPSKGLYILRPKTVALANNLAEAMETACNNPNIGYDQNGRLGVIKNGINSTVKTEADCSSLVRACIINASNVDVGNFTTANEASVLVNSGLFEDKVAYISQSKTPVYNGDVLVTKTKGHTLIVVRGNARQETNSIYYPKCSGTSTSIVNALKEVGESDTTYLHRKQIAKANGIIGYTGTASQNITLVKLLQLGKLIKV